MGAWGGGLYDSDFARDLRATITGMLRAPLGEDDLLTEFVARVGDGVDGAEALDGWLVLADRFERRGMPRRAIFERAIEIVETGVPGTPLVRVVGAGRDEDATRILGGIVAAMTRIAPEVAGAPTARDWGRAFDRYVASGDDGDPQRSCTRRATGTASCAARRRMSASCTATCSTPGGRAMPALRGAVPPRRV